MAHRDKKAPTQRPILNVETDLAYSMERYLNSHTHVEDGVLRPPPHYYAANPQTPPLTVDESKARMAGLIRTALAKASGSAPAPGPAQQK
ncbi:hypothetical protein F5Y17DRAFT_416269 [Xylariaceae sp. FL0594]|nr:hypothetical protein F5Y17DRAFT_416269 [Xylariaceae sp. FL0594]